MSWLSVGLDTYSHFHTEQAVWSALDTLAVLGALLS